MRTVRSSSAADGRTEGAGWRRGGAGAARDRETTGRPARPPRSARHRGSTDCFCAVADSSCFSRGPSAAADCSCRRGLPGSMGASLIHGSPVAAAVASDTCKASRLPSCCRIRSCRGEARAPWRPGEVPRAAGDADGVGARGSSARTSGAKDPARNADASSRVVHTEMVVADGRCRRRPRRGRPASEYLRALDKRLQNRANSSLSIARHDARKSRPKYSRISAMRVWFFTMQLTHLMQQRGGLEVAGLVYRVSSSSNEAPSKLS